LHRPHRDDGLCQRTWASAGNVSACPEDDVGKKRYESPLSRERSREDEREHCNNSKKNHIERCSQQDDVREQRHICWEKKAGYIISLLWATMMNDNVDLSRVNPRTRATGVRFVYGFSVYRIWQ
jgi:hypothetical protein